MPFDPQQIVLHRGQTQWLVAFYNKQQGPGPWTVVHGTIGEYPVQSALWTFQNVGAHPDPEKASTWMQGTLTLNANALNQDPWLNYSWPTTQGEATLELSVFCNTLPRPLTAKLVP